MAPSCRRGIATPARLHWILILTALLVPAVPVHAAPSPGADSLVLVLPHDGRAPQPVPIVRRGQGSYLPLVPLARALAVPFSWDPFTYRGWITTDTTQTLFTLASPVLTRGEESRQLAHALAYAEAGVLIPLDYLALLAERWNGGRMVRWRPDAGTFDWGSAVPAVGHARFSQIGHRTTLRLETDVVPRTTLLWSHLGGLEVLLEGVAVDPESLAAAPRREGLSIRSVRSRPGGCELDFDVGAGVLGIAVGYEEREQVWKLMTTTSREEVARGGFHPLERIERPPVSRTGPIVLACWVDPVIDLAEGAEALRDLAEQVAEVLSSRLDYEAVVVEGRNAVRMAGRANGYEAGAVVGLRIDRTFPALGAAQVWTAVPRLRWQLPGSTDPDSVETPRPPLWSETPALAAAGSERLAATLAAHLGSLIGRTNVLRGRRPSRWLEGLTMPAVVIYPANASHRGSMRRLSDAGRRARLAQAIALGIAEAVGGAGRGRLQR